MEPERPDLSHVDETVRAYIEALELELLQLRAGGAPAERAAAEPDAGEPPTAEPEPSEPPTTVQLITLTASGIAKRTPRHFYTRQRRGGMGVFDLETAEQDPPTLLALADLSADLLFVTDQGRVFRRPVQSIPQTAVRGRGAALGLELLTGESIVALLPADADQYLMLVSQRGWVRRVRSSYLNRNMIQGIRYHKVNEGGYVTGACWTNGVDDVLIATRNGQAIRFSERQIPSGGCLGLRVDPDDEAIAVAGTSEGGRVLLIGHDGKGAIRLMGGLRQNKAPGAGGKALVKVERLMGAQAVAAGDDVFIISRLSKVIRFAADEIPPKEGVVQGVNCMSLRADEVAAFVVARIEVSPA